MLNKKNKTQQEYGQDVQNGHYAGPMSEGQGGAHHTSKPFKTKLMQVCNNKCNNLNKTILTMVFLMLHILMNLGFIKKEAQVL